MFSYRELFPGNVTGIQGWLLAVAPLFLVLVPTFPGAGPLRLSLLLVLPGGCFGGVFQHLGSPLCSGKHSCLIPLISVVYMHSTSSSPLILEEASSMHVLPSGAGRKLKLSCPIPARQVLYYFCVS